jgi:hypothetical protein
MNYEFILKFIKNNYSLKGKKFYIPENIDYALPTSEKMFVGNIPTGTKFMSKKLAVGIYWENDWGARDLDLSGINVGGKVGWNSDYKQGGGSLMYSGDITNAPSGAVEYLYANKGLKEPTLVQNNVFSGSPTCGYKIVVGKGDKVSENYMMNPDKVWVETKCESVQKQTVLGMLIPEDDKQTFVLLNFGAGNVRVSGNSETTTLATKALFQQWKNPISFNDLVSELGGKLVDSKEKADIDLSLDNLEKDTFTKLFK